MRDGKYIVESIENGMVKLMDFNDESIEEFINQNEIAIPIKQGYVLEVKNEKGKSVFTFLESETAKRREMAENLLKKRINKDT